VESLWADFQFVDLRNPLDEQLALWTQVLYNFFVLNQWNIHNNSIATYKTFNYNEETLDLAKLFTKPEVLLDMFHDLTSFAAEILIGDAVAQQKERQVHKSATDEQHLRFPAGPGSLCCLCDAAFFMSFPIARSGHCDALRRHTRSKSQTIDLRRSKLLSKALVLNEILETMLPINLYLIQTHQDGPEVGRVM